jgi:hypothetical protein
MKETAAANLEERTARLTVLIDPRKKAVFEGLCTAEDVTPSQVVRRMVREYIEQRLGRPWDSVAQPVATTRQSTKGHAPKR